MNCREERQIIRELIVTARKVGSHETSYVFWHFYLHILETPIHSRRCGVVRLVGGPCCYTDAQRDMPF